MRYGGGCCDMVRVMVRDVVSVRRTLWHLSRDLEVKVRDVAEAVMCVIFTEGLVTRVFLPCVPGSGERGGGSRVRTCCAISP